jgi:hypothetical protein
VVSHRGQPISNSDVLVHAIRPRVDILNNGTCKGGQPDAMKILRSSRPLLKIFGRFTFLCWANQEYIQPGMFIANLVDDPQMVIPVLPISVPQPNIPAPQHNGPAYWIKVSAKQDGRFTVTNQRNGFSKTYAAR